MSTNVYGPQNGPAPDFLRNTYDKQFQNLITTNFGELRPCFCKEVLPGDSVNIDPIVAIRSQPIVFPIQTRMKFYCHFFYGRNRILMKNWEDFIFKTKDGIIPPLLKMTPTRAKQMVSTGSLGDNLGVPSTIGISTSVSGSVSVASSTSFILPVLVQNPDFTKIKSAYASMVGNDIRQPDGAGLRSGLGYWSGECFSSLPLGDTLKSMPFTSSQNNFSTSSAFICFTDKDYKALDLSPISFVNLSPIIQVNYQGVSTEDGFVVSVDTTVENQLYQVSTYLLEKYGSYRFYIGTWIIPTPQTATSYFPLPSQQQSSTNIPRFYPLISIVEGIHDATSDDYIRFNKFIGDNPQIPLSALPMRLYEFCCNYYYRNDTNNPYILDNEPQYNKFIPSTDDGWDENIYLIHHRNWESDMFTTAVPSPQFGTAPLVGLTYNGGLTAEVTTNVTDSDGQTKQLGIKVGVDDEGNITNIFNADTAVPSGSLKQLMDAMSTTGISINTLRNVNSFQRFLENVIRRGLRYRNQLLSHFGVSVDYPDIDIPQFIGGFSGDLVVRDVTNMSESSDVVLGDVAGKIDAVIQSNHSINCYCAEHGFIMGIFCIVPVPTYSQVLPNMFTRYDAFDYFQKEFDKVGYVPITYRNFLPLQCDNPDEVFGYQRAWYDYMSSLDEVHGDFRLTLDDFVLYRIFKDKPTLNESFLTVDSDSLNNIFAVDKVEDKYHNADKFLCQFYFHYSQKTMIPKHGVASLE